MLSRIDLEANLRKAWAERGCELAEGQRMGVAISELVEHSVRRNAELDAPYVDLWVVVLDEFISWQLSPLTVFYGERRERVKFTDFDQAVTMLLMKIIGDSTAIRHLILLGFDTSARTLLRSTAEYMELFVAILTEPRLAQEFVNTDTPGAATRFWKAHLAFGGIRKKMYAAWRQFFNAQDHESAQWFSNWGSSSNDLLSAMLHPSYAGGVFTAIPFKSKYTEEKWLGVWGDKSEGSVGTVYIYASFMFPILLLHRVFPFKGFEAHLGGGRVKYDKI